MRDDPETGRTRRAEGETPFVLGTSWSLELPPGNASRGAPLVVALHGMGQDRAILRRTLGEGFTGPWALLTPDAPLPFEARTEDGGRRIGRAWYLYTGDQEDFLAWAGRAEDHLFEIVEEVVETHDLDASRIALLGYSQGGYLAGIVALRNPDAFAALVTVNSRLKVEVLGDAPAPPLPVLVLHGERDRQVPLRAAEDSAREFARRGGAVEVRRFPSGHRFTPEEVEAARDWLRPRLGG